MNINNSVRRFMGTCMAAFATFGMAACGHATEAGEAAIPYVSNDPGTWLSDRSYRPSELGLDGINLDLKVPKQEVLEQDKANAMARFNSCVIALNKQYGTGPGRFGTFVYGPGSKPIGHQFDLDANGINAYIGDFAADC